MPPNTVKVDRSTKWGNPFRAGYHDTAENCAYRFKQLVSTGIVDKSFDFFCLDEQHDTLDIVQLDLHELRGKNLACWCKIGEPCHADELLKLANK